MKTFKQIFHTPFLIMLWLFCLALLPGMVKAQPAAVQKASKAVFTLTTFKADGSLLSSTHGVFIATDGTAVSTFAPFVGAAKATVIDAAGKSYDVDCLLGGNELYDVAKFRVTGTTPAGPHCPHGCDAGGSGVVGELCQRQNRCPIDQSG